MDFVNKKTQWVELIVEGIPGGNMATQFQFTPQTYLSGMSTRAISTYSAADVPISPYLKPVISITQLKSMFLTLYFHDPNNPGDVRNFVRNLPMLDLHRISNGTDPYVRDLFLINGPVVIWENSFITTSAPLANTVDMAILFNVSYE